MVAQTPRPGKMVAPDVKNVNRYDHELDFPVWRWLDSLPDDPLESRSTRQVSGAQLLTEDGYCAQTYFVRDQ